MRTKYTSGLIIATVACLVGSSLHRGYTNEELNPFEFQIRDYLKIFCYDMHHVSNNTTVAVVNYERVTALWSAYSSITYVGSMIGCLTISIMADRFGRKNSLLIVTGLCGVLTLLQNLAIYLNMYPLILIGRMFNGYGAAVSSSLTCLYLIEIAPEHLRWGFAAADSIFLTSGSVIPAMLALPSLLGSSSLWVYVFIVGSALLIPLLFLTCQPEGLAFLIQQMKSQEAIVSSIYHYQGADADVSAILEAQAKRVISTSDRPVFRQFAMLRQKKWRNHILITIALGSGIAYAGAAVIITYATSIIVDAGFNVITAKKCYIGVSILRILVGVIFALKIDKISNRRKLLVCTLWIIVGLLVGLILIDVIDGYGLKSAWMDVHTFLVVVKIFLIFTWFGFVSLAVPLVVTTNLQCYPQNQRAAGSAFYMLIGYVNYWAITAVYPIIQLKLGICSVVLLLPILVTATIYLHIKLPETNGTDSDDVSNAIAFGRPNQSKPSEICPLLDSEGSEAKARRL